MTPAVLFTVTIPCSGHTGSPGSYDSCPACGLIRQFKGCGLILPGDSLSPAITPSIIITPDTLLWKYFSHLLIKLTGVFLIFLFRYY
jgi:hypothetical protein